MVCELLLAHFELQNEKAIIPFISCFIYIHQKPATICGKILTEGNLETGRTGFHNKGKH